MEAAITGGGTLLSNSCCIVQESCAVITVSVKWTSQQLFLVNWTSETPSYSLKSARVYLFNNRGAAVAAVLEGLEWDDSRETSLHDNHSFSEPVTLKMPLICTILTLESLRAADEWKTYCCDISRNATITTENCLNRSKLYSAYHLFEPCVTVYLANRMESDRHPWRCSWLRFVTSDFKQMQGSVERKKKKKIKMFSVEGTMLPCSSAGSMSSVSWQCFFFWEGRHNQRYLSVGFYISSAHPPKKSFGNEDFCINKNIQHAFHIEHVFLILCIIYAYIYYVLIHT